MVFYIWLLWLSIVFSRSICIVAYISVSFLFVWLLWIMLLVSVIDKFLSEHIFSFLLGRSEMTVFNFWRNCQAFFMKFPFYVPLAIPHPSQHLLFVWLFNLVNVKWYLMVFMCILMLNILCAYWPFVYHL